MSRSFHPVAAILLTGGSSRRMGRDKSQLIINGSTMAVRTAELLLSVVETVVEVGPGVSGLPVTRENPAGEGPLAAVAAGNRKLQELNHGGSVLVVACDLPFLSEPLLRLLAEWSSVNTVLPIVRDHPQPLCARWAGHDLEQAQELLDLGVRSLRHLAHRPGVELLSESSWGRVVSEEVFSDIDSPEDLRRLGLEELLGPVPPVH
ncbi:MAG: molybdenum cofactor guanylyltransferase [Acidimicrobiales bacterium]